MSRFPGAIVPIGLDIRCVPKRNGEMLLTGCDQRSKRLDGRRLAPRRYGGTMPARDSAPPRETCSVGRRTCFSSALDGERKARCRWISRRETWRPGARPLDQCDRMTLLRRAAFPVVEKSDG